MTGTVFDIKEFAIYDGPGVRQTVFFKGCPLHCSWCHNPEGLCPAPELWVSTASCMNCGGCQSVCPSGKWDDAHIRAADCTGCGKCIDICPAGIRRICGQRYRPEELADRLLKRSGYYAELGGGVTFSGGEPLLQASFLMALTVLLPGIHKAIETSGYAGSDTFAGVLAHMDYVIMDIKCISDALHRSYTGVSNRRILRNYRLLRESGKPHTVRIPLIGGVSHTVENLTATAELLAGDPSLDWVELLPYQPAAGAKYRQVGREYGQTFDVGKNPAESVEIFEKYRLRCRVL